MAAETMKRRRSASVWNWFGRMRWDHFEQRRKAATGPSAKSKLQPSTAAVKPDANLNVSCLTLLDESPMKRRWMPKRMTRPVSCYMLQSSGVEGEDKRGSYYETHFPSEPNPHQRVTAPRSIQAVASLDCIDRQVQNFLKIIIIATLSGV